MIPEFKKRLKLEVDVFLTKYPTATSKDIKNFLFLGEPAQELFTINPQRFEQVYIISKRGSLLNLVQQQDLFWTIE